MAPLHGNPYNLLDQSLLFIDRGICQARASSNPKPSKSDRQARCHRGRRVRFGVTRFRVRFDTSTG
jgi:hypothetical protein